jgi:signal transduction histidine kinase
MVSLSLPSKSLEHPAASALPRLDALFAVLCAAAFTGAALVLLGWEINETAFKAGAAGLRATQPLTATGLIAAACALYLGKVGGRGAQALRRALALLVMAMAAVVLMQNLLDVDWGTDRLLFPVHVVYEQTGPYLRAGRPAGSALLGFIALGWCLLTLRSSRPAIVQSYLVTAHIGLLGATIALLAYGLNIAPLYVMGLYAQASLPASLMFWLLFAGAVIARPEQGSFARLQGDSLGAISARSILCWTTCLLVVLIAVVQFSSHAHWYRSELVVLFVTVTGLTIMFLGLSAHMRRIDQIEDARLQINRQARSLHAHAVTANEAYRVALEDKRRLIANLAHELRNPLAALAYSHELLQLRGEQVENREQLLAVMGRQIARLKAILDSGLAEYDKPQPDGEPR